MLDLHHQFARLDVPPKCYHWRAHSGVEVDMILERDGILWPIEIKCKSKISAKDTTGIKAFRETYPHQAIGPGVVIAAVTHVQILPGNIFVIPYDLR